MTTTHDMTLTTTSPAIRSNSARYARSVRRLGNSAVAAYAVPAAGHGRRKRTQPSPGKVLRRGGRRIPEQRCRGENGGGGKPSRGRGSCVIPVARPAPAELRQWLRGCPMSPSAWHPNSRVPRGHSPRHPRLPRPLAARPHGTWANRHTPETEQEPPPAAAGGAGSGSEADRGSRRGTLSVLRYRPRSHHRGMPLRIAQAQLSDWREETAEVVE
jgi:hypothetical protein